VSVIKTGDMVRLVWGCCSTIRRRIGWVGTVSNVDRLGGFCDHCGYYCPGSVASIRNNDDAGIVASAWLIKIDPPAEREDVSRDEEITA